MTGSICQIALSDQYFLVTRQQNRHETASLLGLVHTFQFSTGRHVPIIGGRSSRAHAYLHNPVVWPAGKLPADCRVATGDTSYHARSPAGSRVSRVAYRHADTLLTHSGFYLDVSE